MEGNPKQWGLSVEDLQKCTPKQISEDKGLALKVMLPPASTTAIS